MKLTFLLGFILSLLFLFQNCGTSDEDPGLFVRDDTSSFNASFDEDQDCFEDLCLPPSETLWLKIKESNPYTVNRFYNTSNHFDVGGTCSSGAFERHTIHWELRHQTGSQAVVGEGFVDNACRVGKYSIAVSASIQEDTRYELLVEILGVDESNQAVTNPLRNNSAIIDVIVISEDNQQSNGEEE